MTAAESPAEILERLAREREDDARRLRPPTALPVPPPTVASLQAWRPHHHEANLWRWEPMYALWLGRCRICGKYFPAPGWKAVELERDAARYADAHPLPHLYGKSDRT